jgi:protein phosphatase
MPYRMRAFPDRLVDYAGSSTVGRSRDVNEDAWGALESESIFVVADGVGAGGTGREAADIAVGAFRRTLGERRDGFPATMDPFAVSALDANAQILRAAVGSQQGMGCAVAALRFEPPWVIVLALGDCRVYRYRRGLVQSYQTADAKGGVLARMTTDDDLWLQMLRNGSTFTQAENSRRNHPNVITRVLGMGSELDVDVRYAPIVPGDLYLLCTDGLTRQLDDDGIRAIVGDLGCPLADRCEQLVRAADAAQGADNVTAVIVHVQSAT